MSNFKLHEFHPQIYPRRLWVAKGGTFEDISALFTAMDGEELGKPNTALLRPISYKQKAMSIISVVLFGFHRQRI